MLKFNILQLRDEYAPGRIFRGLDANGPTNLNHYRIVYDGFTEELATTKLTLANVFTRFNVNRPADFRGHSLSVSDLVMLDDCRIFYCDTIGWVELTGEHAPVKFSRIEIDITGGGR